MIIRRALAPLLFGVGIAAATPSLADDAHLVAVKAAREAGGTWRFEATVRSNDTGWDRYADRWEVLAPDGRVLGKRVLLHPHENEQPFTRSRTGDKVKGYGGRTATVTLPE